MTDMERKTFCAALSRYGEPKGRGNEWNSFLLACSAVCIS